MTQLSLRDSQGFYQIPLEMRDLVTLLLPRASESKIDRLRTELNHQSAKSLTIDHLTAFLTEKEAGIILAAIELGRIAWTAPTENKTILDSPGEAYKVFSEILRGKASEHFVVLFLDIKNRLIDKQIVSIGSWSETLVPIAEILRLTLVKRCPRIIVAHNHPSGLLEPSSEDYRVTEDLGKACNMVGIVMLDHLVVADHGYTSIRQTGSFGKDVWGKT
jgi:DNA repair protein RadC